MRTVDTKYEIGRLVYVLIMAEKGNYKTSSRSRRETSYLSSDMQIWYQGRTYGNVPIGNVVYRSGTNGMCCIVLNA